MGHPTGVYIRDVYTEAVMGVERQTRTFKSGNSVAVRLPKELGIAAGVEVRVREERGRFIVEPVTSEKRKIDLTGIAGSMPWLEPLSPEDRELEMRELDWDGKKLTRD